MLCVHLLKLLEVLLLGALLLHHRGLHLCRRHGVLD